MSDKIYKVKIEKLDNQGRGICYINDKITFVPNTLPNEIVNIEIIEEKKKYNLGNLKEILTKSEDRIKSPCPYFEKCTNCELFNTTYEKTLEYKSQKLSEILEKYADIKKDIEVIPSPNKTNYRNKLTLKVKDGNYGYYKSKSHELIPINNCLLAEDAINSFLKDLDKLNLNNGEVVIRSNYNSELIISITTEENPNVDIDYLREHHKIVGIVLNDKPYYGEQSFIEIINHQLFNVSYNSFFQVNRGICKILFDLINEHIGENEVIMDLYCGVGTLGINATKKASKCYGIEIIKNAILNAITNSKINKRDNIYYMLGDVEKCLPKIKEKVDTIIIDPPRKGLDKTSLKNILESNTKKIIYVSCDPVTLSRDLKTLSEKYDVSFIKGLDMFPYTRHVETLCVLNLR